MNAKDKTLSDLALLLIDHAADTLDRAWDILDSGEELDRFLVPLMDVRQALLQQAYRIRTEQDPESAATPPAPLPPVAKFRWDLVKFLESTSWHDDADEVREADDDRLAALQRRCGTAAAAAYLIVRRKRDW